MRLLVAIDSSPVSDTIIREVVRRPWAPGTIASVLHVLDLALLPTNANVLQTVYRSAEVLVNSASAKLGGAGLQTEAKVLEGDPRSTIAEYAQKSAADMAFVGSHGASGLVRFLLGSVAQGTLRRSPCSVEIVRQVSPHGAARPSAMKILLATDGSDCSMAAAASVADRPWPPASQIRVISVIPLVAPFTDALPTDPVYYLSPDVGEELQKQARTRAEEAVARARKVLEHAHTKVVEIDSLPLGDPREVILDQAKNWGADLIVTGSHGYRGIDRLMLGSVSEAVAMHAHCSVEVIRENSAARQA